MNHLLRGFAVQLLKLAQDEPCFVDDGPIDYEPNLNPIDARTRRPNAAEVETFPVGELGEIEKPKETIDAAKFNHWYRYKG